MMIISQNADLQKCSCEKSQNKNHENHICYKVCSEKLLTITQNLPQAVPEYSTTRREQSFVCPWPMCDKSFGFSEVLQLHLSMHEGSRCFKCTICNMAFVKKTELDEHLLKHRSESFSCTWADCNRSFAFEEILQLHLCMHTDNDSIKGSGDTELSGNDQIKDQFVIGEEKSFICTWPNCAQSFAFEDVLSLHLRMHAECKLFKCSLCDMKFLTNDHLTKHTKNHTNVIDDKPENIPSPKVENDECMQQCTDHNIMNDVECTNGRSREISSTRDAKRQYTKRLRTSCACSNCANLKYEPNARKQHICNFVGCGKLFSTPTLLLNHERNYHKFVCDFEKCGKSFKTFNCLNNHRRFCKNNKIHSNIEESISSEVQHSKEVQPVLFSLRKSHKWHNTRTHIRKFKCDWENCTKSYTRGNNLRMHRRLKHGVCSVIACDWKNCFKTFKGKSARDRHLIKYHGKSIICTCSNCIFGQRKIDTEKLHICDYVGCGKLYLEPVLLINHARVHSVHSTIQANVIKGNESGETQHSKVDWDTEWNDQNVDDVKSSCDDEESQFKCEWVNNRSSFTRRKSLNHLLNYQDVGTVNVRNPSNHPVTKNYLLTTEDDCDEGKEPSDQSIAECAKVKKQRGTNQKSDGIYKCHWENCTKIFTTLWGLHQHAGFVHRVSKFTCCFKNCWKSFEARNSLEHHCIKYHGNKSSVALNSSKQPESDRNIDDGTKVKKPRAKNKKTVGTNERVIQVNAPATLTSLQMSAPAVDTPLKMSAPAIDNSHVNCPCSYCLNGRHLPNSQKVHICDFNRCGKLFLSTSLLLSHKHTHIDKGSFVNNVENVTKSNQTLNNDRNRYENSELYTLLVQKRINKSNQQARNLNRPGIIFNCDYCEKTYTWRESLLYHLEHQHNNTGLYKCDSGNCKETFRTIALLAAHRQKWHGLTCSCDNCTSNKNDPNKTIQHKCGVEGCGKMFARVLDFLSHEQLHISSNYATTRYESNFEKDSQLILNQCENNVGNQSKILVNHESDDLALPNHTYECQYCGHIYKCHRSLVDHHRNVHKGKGLYKCDWKNCMAWFGSFELLIQHRGKNHFICKCSNCAANKIDSNTNNQHICDFEECGKLFSTSSALICHQRLHKLPIITT